MATIQVCEYSGESSKQRGPDAEKYQIKNTIGTCRMGKRKKMWKKEIIYEAAKPILYYLVKENGELFLKHTYDCDCENPVVEECFILPSQESENNKACRITAKRPFRVAADEKHHRAEILFDGTEEEISLSFYPGIPHCDMMGNAMILEFENGQEFEEAVYQFYWKTLLPSVAERTAGAGYPVRYGYVVSTLQKEVYAGTYPDVDHEFQIKGRAAMGDTFELGLIRRMLELQLKLMAEDPEQLYRDPCSLQPDGVREYHVRRSSKDLQTNAVMFLITGNVEIIESVWLYVAASGDWDWFLNHKEGLENSLSLVEDCMDRQGRLWSDVYYEDQIIKDGRECMSAALAADAMRRMADLERRAGDSEKEKKYLELERKLARAMTADLPGGFWDRENGRFIDWVDRCGITHDHIHLLANELPLLFGYADAGQEKAVQKLLEECFDEFQRFPTFLSARIQDYTDSEIGLPYDLCAAGRYWCWDFAFWESLGRKDMLERQLLAVCRQAKLDGYLMGERYDMNHIFYQDDKNWHGAAHYYEYPCVFIWNLIRGYLGVQPDLDVDVKIAPMLNRPGKVRLEAECYALEYEMNGSSLSVKNLLDRQRTFLLCMNGKEKKVTLGFGESISWDFAD